MEQFKRAKVLILPANSKTDIFLNEDIPRLYFKDNTTLEGYQHLYIISDDEIKENDWCIDIEDNVLFQVKEQGHSGLLRSTTDSFIEDNCKKVITTTDNSLTLYCNCKITCKTTKEFCNEYKILPQVSQQFIEKYIESYNKKEIITDVLVEYENINTTKKEDYKYENGKGNLNYIWRIKIDKNNTITIKKLKDSWNRNELIHLIKKASKIGTYDDEFIDDWIEENS